MEVEPNLPTLSKEDGDKGLRISYQSAIGSLMYAMTQIRPDHAFAVSRLSQYCSNPMEEHWKAVKRVMRYLKGTATTGILYGRVAHQGLVGFTDAAYGDDKGTRRSTGAYLFFYGGAPISWQSKRQQTVALSTCEAEYMAAAQATKEAIWLQGLLHDVDPEWQQVAVTIFCDNQGAIALAENPSHHSRSKHIDIQYHFIREAVQNTKIRLEYLPTEQMPADGLTKPLVPAKFTTFQAHLNLQSHDTAG
jgi:hypothetical protein